MALTEILGKLVIRSHVQFEEKHGKQIILATYGSLDKSEAQEKFRQFVTRNEHIDRGSIEATWEVIEPIFL